jgi:hypothetical protein
VAKPQLKVVTTHTVERAAETAATQHTGKTVLKALAAPVLGLVLFLGFPAIGLAIIARYAAEAVWERRGRIAQFVKDDLVCLTAAFAQDEIACDEHFELRVRAAQLRENRRQRSFRARPPVSKFEAGPG